VRKIGCTNDYSVNREGMKRDQVEEDEEEQLKNE
jgi:hypothetical protein